MSIITKEGKEYLRLHNQDGDEYPDPETVNYDIKQIKAIQREREQKRKKEERAVKRELEKQELK